MEDRRYIVFDAVSTGPGEEDFSFSPALGDSLDTLLRVESMTPFDASDQRQAPGRVVAEPMPTTLVAPVAMADADTPPGPGVAWGVEVVGASASSLTGQGIRVAVLDTGIDAGHVAFQGVNVTQEDFTGDGNGDEVGHGTHCAGTIVGRDVNGFRFGVATGVTELLAGKVLGPNGGTTEALVNGLIWALRSGANVISMSLGFDFPGAVAAMVAQGLPIQPATSQALEAYRDNLRLFGALASFMQASNPFGHAALVVAASGNESERNAQKPYTIGVSPPAASEGFIPVAALGQAEDKSLSIAYFSNTGAMVAGPGVDIISAKAGGGFTQMSGTSMATPHAAGVAALWAESLMASSGQIDAGILTARLVASGQLGALAAGDVGAGLVQAPSS